MDKTTYIDTITTEVAKRTKIKDRTLVRYYALLVLTKGEHMTLSDIHDAWAMNMNFKPQTNTCYGHSHKSIEPFHQLPDEVKDKDQRYLRALKTLTFEYTHPAEFGMEIKQKKARKNR